MSKRRFWPIVMGLFNYALALIAIVLALAAIDPEVATSNLAAWAWAFGLPKLANLLMNPEFSAAIAGVIAALLGVSVVRIVFALFLHEGRRSKVPFLGASELERERERQDLELKALHKQHMENLTAMKDEAAALTELVRDFTQAMGPKIQYPVPGPVAADAVSTTDEPQN